MINHPSDNRGKKRVLFIHDDELDSVFLQDILESDNYSTVWLNSGEKGLDLAKEQNFSMIIVNLTLNDISGLEFIRSLRANNINVPCIIMVENNSQGHIIKALQAGACDFLIKPINKAILLHTVKNHIQVWEKLEELKSYRSDKKQGAINSHFGDIIDEIKELMSCDEKNIPEELGFYSYFEPAHHLGGDFYDIFNIDDDLAAIIIGDAAGQGLKASYLAFMAKNIIQSSLLRGKKVEDILEDINKIFLDSPKSRSYMSLIIVIADKKNHLLNYWNCGHEKPLLLSQDKYAKLEGSEMILGAMAQPKYKSFQIPFVAGDRLILISDGLIGAANNKGDRFGWERFSNLIDWYKIMDSQSLMNKIISKITDFAGPAFQEKTDDLTLIIVELSKIKDNNFEEITLCVPARKNSLQTIIDAINFLGRRFENEPKDMQAISSSAETILENMIELLNKKVDNWDDIQTIIRLYQDKLIIFLRIASDVWKDMAMEDPLDRLFPQRALYLESKLIDGIEISFDKTGTLMVSIKKLMIEKRG